MFLHYYSPQLLYQPPEPFASSFGGNLYAGEIAYADYCIGQVVEKLKSLGLYESSLIIVTSDHGEMLGEHGEEDHGYFIYQSAIKVPLIFISAELQLGQRVVILQIHSKLQYLQPNTKANFFIFKLCH